MTYLTQLSRAMLMLAEQRSTVFMGQAVAFPGTGMTQTFAGVPRGQLLELPVVEEMQLGMAEGIALGGFLPVCVYPRFNFIMRAMDQLVNHLDKLPEYGNGYRPKVIVRTAVASPKPMDPGPQHLGDFTTAMKLMLRNVHVERLDRTGQVLPAYQAALEREGSSLLIEVTERYEND